MARYRVTWEVTLFVDAESEEAAADLIDEWTVFNALDRNAEVSKATVEVEDESLWRDGEFECDVCGAMVPQHQIKTVIAAGGTETSACKQCRGDDEPDE